MPSWMSKALDTGIVKPVAGSPMNLGATISTLEGEMVASPGDYIILDMDGELYPCKPDIFEKTYENVAPPEEVEYVDCCDI